MSNLESNGINFEYLLLEFYKKLGLNENELAVILQIDHLLKQKNSIITADLLSIKMTLSIKDLDTILSNLINKNYVTYEISNKTKISLKPLKKRLLDLFQLSLAKELEDKNNEEKSKSIKNIYEVFEKELGRTLSPLELELIGNWVNEKYKDEDIINALKDSIKQGKKSLKNVDRILLEYRVHNDIEKEGVTAVKENWDKDIDETMKIIQTKWLDD